MFPVAGSSAASSSSPASCAPPAGASGDYCGAGCQAQFSVGGVCASPPLPTNITVATNCSDAQHVAITFDDGPWTFSREIAQAFTAAGMNITFMVNGLNRACIYDEPFASDLLASFKDGHQIV